jgi:ADP-dependent NAD(P)H-hydrate dehydratase
VIPLSALDERRLDDEQLRRWPFDDEQGDKHERGTVLVVGGTAETPGGVLLAAIAALRMGAGRVQIATAADAAVAVAVAVPEARVVDARDLELVTQMSAEAQAVVVGSGLLDPSSAGPLLASVMRAPGSTPVVVDAAAVAAYPANGNSRHPVVLTANVGELSSIAAGCDPGDRDDDVTATASRTAVEYGAVVVTLGRVAAPDGTVWRHGHHVSGLGTSGSGDVLAGAVAGALARCGDSQRAACWGMYAHRRAADRLVERVGSVGYLAREVADELPAVLREVLRR